MKQKRTQTGSQSVWFTGQSDWFLGDAAPSGPATKVMDWSDKWEDDQVLGFFLEWLQTDKASCCQGERDTRTGPDSTHESVTLQQVADAPWLHWRFSRMNWKQPKMWRNRWKRNVLLIVIERSNSPPQCKASLFIFCCYICELVGEKT